MLSVACAILIVLGLIGVVVTCREAPPDRDSFADGFGRGFVLALSIVAIIAGILALMV